jgi:alkanesulfonate monooxygenase SsuD/methylene tetrahydromethanopterin reductase-like flavin-dependent oxidoreductase (luciferase family)
MGLQFGVFDHIEPEEGKSLAETYEKRLKQIEYMDRAGFYCYHLAEHHTPAIHSLAPSQNVFLAAASQRTTNIHLAPCVYVLPLHHPLRLIEEISMVDTLSNGRMEIGVGRGGEMEAIFWGQEATAESNYERYQETLAVIQNGLSNDRLNFQGSVYNFDDLPMFMHSVQKPYPPMWYMRNAETAAINGMDTIIVGSLDSIGPEAKRYKEKWEEHQGTGALTIHGKEPKIGLTVHMVLAETDEEAIAIATPAWEQYRYNLAAPRRIEAERRGLDRFMSTKDGQGFGFVGNRPADAPARELRRDIDAEIEKFDSSHTTQNPGRLGGVAMAGSPASMREYLDEYVESGANYYVCSFQWGSITSDEAMRSIRLFTEEVMPHYVDASAEVSAD